MLGSLELGLFSDMLPDELHALLELFLDRGVLLVKLVEVEARIRADVLVDEQIRHVTVEVIVAEGHEGL